MSISPEVAQEPPEFALRPIITTTRTAIQSTEDHRRITAGGADDEECRTPTSEESRLPSVPRCCPPAPKKLKRAPPCKRRLWTLEFDLISVGAKELEQLFQARDVRGELAAPNRPAKKRRIQTATS